MGTVKRPNFSQWKKTGGKGRVSETYIRIGGNYEWTMYRGRHSEIVWCRHIWSKRLLGTWTFPAGTVWDCGQEWIERQIMGLIKRRGSGQMEGSAGVVQQTTWIMEHKLIWEYLTSVTFEDGTPREPSTITIMRGDLEGIKMVMNDRAENLSLWVTGVDVEDGLCQMELLLGTTSPPWRGSYFGKPGKGAKK